jgi:hypothetical protein
VLVLSLAGGLWRRVDARVVLMLVDRASMLVGCHVASMLVDC